MNIFLSAELHTMKKNERSCTLYFMEVLYIEWKWSVELEMVMTRKLTFNVRN